MRIGMLADMYRPHISGVTQYIALNKRFLEQVGRQVYVFTFGDPAPDDEENVIRTPGIPVADTGLFLAFRYNRQGRRLLRTMDLAHVHHPFLSGRMALRYCRPYNIPIVFTSHTRYDLYAQAYLPMLPDQVGTAFLQTYLPSFCREVDLVIAPSAGARRVLVDLGVDAPIEVVPNGVDIGAFRRGAEPIPRERLGAKPGDVVLIYVGRLGPEKNLTTLLNAFAGAQAAYPETRLVLVGDGPERETLVHLAQRLDLGRKVHFAGMVDYRMLPRYLSAADVFVTASVTEVHPLTVIEALAAGLPVVGIRSPGVEDTVTDGVTGLLSPNNLAAFTAVMTRMVGETEMRRRMSLAAREAAEQFAIERTAARVLELYERILSAPRRPRRQWRFAWQRMLDRLA